MSEEYNDNLRRRRRSRVIQEETGSAENGTEKAPEAIQTEPVTENRDPAAEAMNRVPAVNNTAEPAGGDMARLLGQDNRVPAEARRMSASPYGTAGTAVRRPGTRQVQDVRRPGTRPVQADRRPASREASSRGGMASRVNVGYAPGRMNIRNVRLDDAGGQEPLRPYSEHRYPAHTRQSQMNNLVADRNGRKNSEGRDGDQKRKKKLITMLAVLAVIVLAVAVVMLVKPDLMDRITGRKPEETSDRIRDPDETETQALSGDGIPDQNDLTATAHTEGNDSGAEAADPQISGEEMPGGITGNPEPEGNVPEEEPTDPEMPGRDVAEEEIQGPEESEGEAWNPAISEEESWDPEVPEEEIPEENPADSDVTNHEMSAMADLENAEENPAGSDAADPDDPGTTDVAAGADEETSGEAASEPDPAPLLTAEAAPGANPDILTTKIYSGKNVKKEYARLAKEQIQMQPGWGYTRHNLGVITFRGNAFRTNGAVGTVAAANELKQIWELQTGSLKGASQTYYGSGWPGQPAIVWWPKEIRQMSNIDEEKKSIKNMKEVIAPVQDGTIRFLNLEDGTITRNSIKVGYPMNGTPSVHPGGFPYMTVGQSARKLKNKTGKIGLRQYNLYSLTELTPLIDGLDGKLHRAPNNTGSFETSALIDRKSDTLITAGTNGMLYLISLNGELDFNLGLFTYKPETIVAICTKKKEKAAQTAVESSLAMYGKYVFYADMGGVLRCVDTDFLAPVWAVETGDSVMAAVALDQRDTESLDLYTANMLNNRKKGNAQIRRYNALNGSEIWCTEIGVQKDTKNKTASGCKASPVIGENNLSGLVYFTVTGLNDEGREELNVPAETKAALVALDKDTGKVEWTYALNDRSDSSPIAVYDGEGNGWIIQCAWDGTIVMVDGLSGRLIHSLKLEGNIEASPAAFDDIMVVGATGKGTELIYGIRIR